METFCVQDEELKAKACIELWDVRWFPITFTQEIFDDSRLINFKE